MQHTRLGPFDGVSRLALGGGGIGAVWGPTTRDEAIATVHAAVAAGINLFDLAPSYGNGEAEIVMGEAFAGRFPAGVRVTTKCQLGAPEPNAVYPTLRASLEASLTRLRVDHVDCFILHSLLVPDVRGERGSGHASAAGTPLSLYRSHVRAAFQHLVDEGLARAWGVTGIGVPSVVQAVLEDAPRPQIVQCIANLLDSPGGLKRYEEPATPRTLIAAAGARGVGVMGIRAVQAGALTDAFDRPLAGDHPDVEDYRRAAPFRAIASELGVSAAYLAHRYALSIEGVDTVVLGVKDRTELAECVRAESDGPLDAALTSRIDHAVGRA
ncbi:MAG: aldo/keto reductase [Dehalococcoidia bacterium]|nr:MAG: aldo/keto reductase [Dehalococcoidia bacterium]